MQGINLKTSFFLNKFEEMMQLVVGAINSFLSNGKILFLTFLHVVYARYQFENCIFISKGEHV